MRRLLALLAALTLLVSSTGAARAQHQSPGTNRRPLTDLDLLDFVWVADPQVAPDGSVVAFVRVTVDREHDTYASQIWEVATDGASAPRALTAGSHDVGPRWSPDGKRLGFLRNNEHDGQPDPPQVFVLDLSGGDSRAVTRQSEGVASFCWSPDGKTIAVVSATTTAGPPADPGRAKPTDVRVITRATFRGDGSGYRDGARRSRIFMVSVRDGGEPQPGRPFSGSRVSELEPVFSPDGATVFFRGRDVEEADFAPPRTLLYSAASTGTVEPKIIARFEGTAADLAPSPDGRWLAFQGAANADPVRSYSQENLFVVDLQRGAIRSLTAERDADVGGSLTGDQRAPRGGEGAAPTWTPDSASLLVVAASHGRANIISIALADGGQREITRGDQEVQEFSMAAGRTVALISTPTSIGDLFVVGNAADLSDPVRLTSVNQSLFDGLELPTPQPLMFKSFDGRPIDSWYVTPPNFDPHRKYPLILQIHGGPHAAYGHTFTHEFLAQAARGYVVLYVNPRGSTTYGEEFGNAIQYRYPGDDYRDLMGALDAILEKSFVDPQRLGVTGGSGGGLLTNWVIGHTDRFRAAVSQRSIADWEAWWYAADFTLFTPTWFRKPPWEDRDDFAARSPITYADRIKTPLMLVDGDSDYRTPPTAGGEAMFRALKLRHVPVVMVRVPNEGHELSRSGHPWHRVDRLRHIGNWFDKWLQDKPHPEYDMP